MTELSHEEVLNVEKTDHPDLVGGIVWADCELNWIRSYGRRRTQVHKGAKMKTSRIDLIGQNGGDGAHYKYEEVAEKLISYLVDVVYLWEYHIVVHTDVKQAITKLLVENFPDA